MRASLCLITIGSVFLLLHATLGSHVADDGTLMEPFYLEAMGKIAVLLGAATALIMGCWRLSRN